MSKDKFKVQYGGKIFTPTPEDIFAVLHVDPSHRDLDYFAFADHDQREMINVLDAPEAARWIAGWEIARDGLSMVIPQINGKSFQEQYGWRPNVVLIRNRATDQIQEEWTQLEVAKDVHDGQLTIPEETE